MPITQSRLHDLLLAAEDCDHALTQAITEGQALADRLRGLRPTDAELHSALGVFLLGLNRTALLKQALKTTSIIRLEREKYRTSHRKNEWRAEQRLADRGYAFGASAPTSIIAQASPEPEESEEVLRMLEEDRKLETRRRAQPQHFSTVAEMEQRLKEPAVAKPSTPPPVVLPSTNAITEQFQADLAEEQADAALGLFGEPEGPISPGDYSSGKVKGQTV